MPNARSRHEAANSPRQRADRARAVRTAHIAGPVVALNRPEPHKTACWRINRIPEKQALQPPFTTSPRMPLVPVICHATTSTSLGLVQVLHHQARRVHQAQQAT